MSIGDVLLDASGNRMLDAAGNVMLDDGAGNACCCGSGGGGNTTQPPACDCAQLGTLSSAYHAAPSSFASCPQCDTTCTGGSVWDGALSNGGGAVCQWTNSHTCDTTSDGLELTVFLTLVTTEGSICFWRLEVYCQQDGSYVLIWRGEKYTGGTPAGAYPQVVIDGCAAGPASVTVS